MVFLKRKEMFSSIRKRLTNLFISVVLEDNQCLIYGRAIKNGKVIKTLEAVFDNDDSSRLSPNIIDYIKRQAKEYNNYYISALVESIGQGAIGSSKPSEISKFNINIADTKLINPNPNCLIYANNQDINDMMQMFGELELNLLYSPFTLIYRCLEEKGFPANATMYMYNQKDSFALSIFNDKNLLFAAFFRTATDTAGLDEASELSLEDVELEEQKSGVEDLIGQSTDEDEDEFGEDLNVLGDLDEVVNLDSTDDGFNETFDTHKEESEELGNVEESLELFGRDMITYNYIKASLMEFYKNPLYESDFIENLVIFDNSKISQTMIGFLETELMIKVSVTAVSSLEIMNDLAIEEIRL